ncbi:MAG: O-antigen ligase family protein [Atribacterota bacterium]
MKNNTERICKVFINIGVVSLAVSVVFSITLMNIAFGFLFVGFLGLVYTKKLKLFSTGLELPIGLFLFFYILSALVNGSLSGVDSIRDNYWYIFHMYLVVYLFNEKEMGKFIKVLKWSTVGISVYAILQSLVGLTFNLNFNIGGTIKMISPPLIEIARCKGHSFYIGTGIMGHQSTFGVQVLMLIFLVYAGFKRKLWALLPVTALFLTFVYGAWIGFLISVLIYLIVKGKKIAAVSYIFIILISLFLVFPSKTVRLRQAVKQKAAACKQAARVYVNHPVFGTGPGNYREVFKSENPKEDYKPIHSTYADILIEGGLLTFLAFCFFIYRFITLYLRIPYSSKERWRKLHKSSWFALIAVFIMGFFRNYLIDAENAVLVWTIAGIIIKTKKSKWTRRLISSRDNMY